MIDLILAIVILGSVTAGYLRGVAREFLELVAVIAGIPVAFRVGPAIVDAVVDLPAVNAAFVGGVGFLIVLIGTVGLLGMSANARGWLSEPDVPERMAGALMGGLRATVLAWVAATLLAAMPNPAIAAAVQPSTFVRAVTASDGVAISTFSTLTGQADIESIVAFNERFPDGPLITEDYTEIPEFGLDRLTEQQDDAFEILELVNEARVLSGRQGLRWSSDLAEVAEAYAFELYTDGFFAHESPRSGNVADRLARVGISFRTAGENLALAPHARSAHDNLMASRSHFANIMGDYTSMGIGVVEGPLGIMVVQVFHS